jgi:hypothetical protein
MIPRITACLANTSRVIEPMLTPEEIEAILELFKADT